MGWYLYIVGALMMGSWHLCAHKLAGAAPSVIGTLAAMLVWPVYFPGLFVGGILLGLMEGSDGEEKSESSSRSGQGD